MGRVGCVNRPLPLDLLRTFQAVCRAGTLTSGAHALGLSQPSVTGQIQALERAAGQPLLLRQARGVVPTAAGVDLLARSDEPLDALSKVAADLQRDPQRGAALAGRTLRLGGPAELTCTRVLPVLAELVQAGVRVRCELDLPPPLLADLAVGGLDLVISTVRPRSAGISSEPLCDEEFALVASPALVAGLDARQLHNDPAAALREVQLLAYDEQLSIVRRWWRHVLREPPRGQAVVVVPDLRGLRSAASAGAGATVLPTYLCAEELADGQLVRVLAPEDPPINTFYLATRTAAPDEPHVAQARAALLLAARLW